MKINLKCEFDEKEFVREVLMNLPECSISMECTEWKYDDGIYKFFDYEEQKDYAITQEMVEKILPQYIEKLNLGTYNFFNNMQPWAIMDTGNWDASVVDGLIQETIFGEIIYG